MSMIYEKTVITLLLILWPWFFWRMYRDWQKKSRADMVIADADAREKQKWRYHIWGWRMLQVLCQLYLFTVLVRFILS